MQAELEDKEFEVNVPLDFSIDPPAPTPDDGAQPAPQPEPSLAEQGTSIPVDTAGSASRESAVTVQAATVTDEGISVPLKTDADYLDKVTTLVQHAQSSVQDPPLVSGAGAMPGSAEEELDIDLAILAEPEGNDMGIITATMPIRQKYTEPIPSLNPHPLRDIMDPAAMYVLCVAVCMHACIPCSLHFRQKAKPQQVWTDLRARFLRD